MKLIAAIDQGTTSTRCILFRDGAQAAGAQREHRQIFPQPGWVEHDPLEIWNNTALVIREAMAAAMSNAADVAAIGITNQRETIVAWNRFTGRPYCNAIVWQDMRTAEMCAKLGTPDLGGPDRFRRATGLPISTYFSATKIRWMLDNVPAFREGAEKSEAVVGTMDAWLHFNLSPPSEERYPHTDVTNASRTMLMNLETQNWDDELCAAFGVPRHILPVIAPSYCEVPLAMTDPAGPFGGEIPLGAILGDQQAALSDRLAFRWGSARTHMAPETFC
jgi:glycerol kinase